MFSVKLRDPAAFASRIKVLDELCRHFGYQRFEAFIPPVFFGIECAVTVNDPTQIPRSMRPEHDSRLWGIHAHERFLSAAKRLNQFFLGRLGKTLQNFANLRA